MTRRFEAHFRVGRPRWLQAEGSDEPACCAHILRLWESNTISDRPRFEILSAFVLAPLVEEAIFRAAPSRLSGARPGWGGRAAVASAALFGLMHRRFGRWFVAYAFLGGLVLWGAYARGGYWAAVGVHAAANLVDLTLGWRRSLHPERPAE